MTRLLCLLLVFLVFPARAAAPSNAGANPAARSLYAYLAGLPQQTAAKLLSGQHMGLTISNPASNNTVAYGYDHFVKPLVNLSGRHVAIVGADYGSADLSVSFPIDYAPVNAPLLQHWKDGGLVTVMYSARNPWSGKSANDRSLGGPLSELLQPGTAANLSWLRQLDSLAAGLQTLRDAGVVVLFRPLHEMNGTWFWWGYNPNNASYVADIVALWRHMHDYLSKTKGLDNLLWVYNTTPKGSAGIPAEAALYPGDNYVDIVSFDLYATSFDTAAVGAYAALKALGKPVALAEYGPTNKQWAGTFDYTRLLDEIRSKMPDLVYFQVWSDYGSPQNGYALLSMASNLNADKVLTDPMVVTIENLPAGARGGQAVSYSLDLMQGWNLMGNSLDRSIPVAALYGDSAKVISVWRWQGNSARWQVYLPAMPALELQSYAAQIGCDVLTDLKPGDGYWVNARLAFSAGAQAGTCFIPSQADLVAGWNLAATCGNPTPAAYNAALRSSPPGTGLDTLWAWDNPASKWLFYAPIIEAQGAAALRDYAANAGMLDFASTGTTLGNGAGFWLSKP